LTSNAQYNLQLLPRPLGRSKITGGYGKSGVDFTNRPSSQFAASIELVAREPADDWCDEEAEAEVPLGSTRFHSVHD
ncbi:hypothetical protein FRC19_004808, partial [Serendipita sp. 401]